MPKGVDIAHATGLRVLPALAQGLRSRRPALFFLDALAKRVHQAQQVSRGSVDVPFLALRTDSSCLSVALPRPIDAQELAHQITSGCYRLVDALGLGREIRVEGAHDDASVDRRLLMQANEVLSVQGQDGAVFCRREAQNLGVGQSAPALPVS